MDALDRMAERLHAEGRPRVWSLIVTAFGDAAAPRDAALSAARLTALMAPAGIGGGAVRTALSRLVADGLLTRERMGQTSLHRPSPALAAEIRAATPTIYAPPARGWELSFGARPPRSLAVAPGAWLSREHAGAGALRFAASPLETASMDGGGALERGHADALDALAGDLAALVGPDADPIAGPTVDPLRAAAARLLLVHRWRRLVLRWPEVEERWLPAGMGDPRPDVMAALRGLGAPSDRWWETVIGPGLAGAALPGLSGNRSRSVGGG